MENNLPPRPWTLDHATSLARLALKEYEEINNEYLPVIYIYVDENPDDKGGGYRVNIINTFPGKIIGKGGETATKISRFLSYKLATRVYVNASIKVDPYDPVSRYSVSIIDFPSVELDEQVDTEVNQILHNSNNQESVRADNSRIQDDWD